MTNLTELRNVTIAGAITIILVLLLTWRAWGAQQYSNDAIVEAIYQTEGGASAQYLYGIRSVHYTDAAEARRICYNSVRNQRIRHAKGQCPQIIRGTQHDYLTCLWYRYCPPGANNDPKKLNNNWLKNVKRFLGKDEKSLIIYRKDTDKGLDWNTEKDAYLKIRLNNTGNIEITSFGGELRFKNPHQILFYDSVQLKVESWEALK